MMVHDGADNWFIDSGENVSARLVLELAIPRGALGGELADPDWSALPSPTVPDNQARRTALSQIVRTFFKGSPVSAASALVGMAEELDTKELDELEAAIARARQAREDGK